MAQPAELRQIAGKDFIVEIYIDPANKRVRIDHCSGNIHRATAASERLAQENHAEKLIVKAREEQFPALLEKGYRLEAIIDNYFLGSTAFVCSKFFTDERNTANNWIEEDKIISSVYHLEKTVDKIASPADYLFKKMNHNDAEGLAALYREVFRIYPTPLNDPNYIRNTMEQGTVYLGFLSNGKIISAASAEMNHFYKNAELTDCATLSAHRKSGLMKILLVLLEKELLENRIFCAYSIARAQSFGMNAALYQLDYSYRGRLVNNCYIFNKLENMNMWVKDLSSSNN